MKVLEVEQKANHACTYSAKHVHWDPKYSSPTSIVDMQNMSMMNPASEGDDDDEIILLT